jgi:hypothetical protein
VTRALRRTAVLLAAVLAASCVAPATVAAASPPASRLAETSAGAPHSSNRSVVAPGQVKKTLRGIYRTITADMANNPEAVSPYFPPDISQTHDVLRHVLEINGRWIDLHLPRGHHLRAGQSVELSGYGDNTQLNVQDIKVLPGATAHVDTTDVTKTLVILAEWNGKNGDTTTKAKAADVIFTQGNAWWKEVSYGLTSLSGTVVDWVHISGPSGGACYSNGWDIMNQAKAAASARIGSLSSYERTIVYFPYCYAASGAAGWAYVPGTDVWINGYMDKRVTIHEQGHNYGLWHAHSLSCSTLTSSCPAIEYGDDYSAMGSASYTGHFDGAEKSKLLWLPGKRRDVSADSSFTLAPFETASSGYKTAKVALTSSVTYWIEYRTPVGQDKGFPTGGLGLLIHVTGSKYGISDGGSNLVDVAPGSSSSYSEGADVSLKKGGSWTSPYDATRVKITFVGANTTGAQVKVDYGAPLPKVPNAPGSVVAKRGDTTALVNWAAPADNGSALLGYWLYYRKSGTTTTPSKINITSPTAVAGTVTGLTNSVTYDIWVTARNGVGEGPRSAIVQATPVLQPPNATLLAPTTGATINGDTVQISANATPNVESKKAISYVYFNVDGQYQGQDSTSPYAMTWDGSYESDGTHTVQAFAVDTNNRIGKTALVSFQLHKPVPSAVITSADPKPDPNANIRDVVVNITSPGAPISYVNVTTDDGQFVGYVDSPVSGTVHLDWDTRWVANGTYQLTATVGNTLDRTARSAPFQVVINHPTPTATITGPSAGSTQYGNFTVTVDAAKGGVSSADLSQVELIADTNNWVGADYDGSDGWSVEVQAWQLAAGDHIFTARVTDQEGYSGLSSGVAITVAKPTPTVTIISPDGTTPLYGTQAGAFVDVITEPKQSVNAGTPIQSVELLVDGTTLAWSQPVDFDHPEGQWKGQLPLSGMTSGSHVLTARVTDEGQYTGVSAPLPISVIVPSPTVQLAPLSCAHSPCDVAFDVSAIATKNDTSQADIQYVQFLVDGTAAVNDFDGSDGYTGSIEPVNYDSRQHVITAKAYDAFGYVGISDPQTITFLTPGPTAAITSPASGASVQIDITPLQISATVTAAPDGHAITQMEVDLDGAGADYKYPADIHDGNKVDFMPSYVAPGTHSVVVKVMDDLGRTRSSDPITITALMKPQQPTVYASPGDGVITLTVYAPYDSGGSAVDKYVIKRYTGEDTSNLAETRELTAPEYVGASQFNYDFTGMPSTPETFEVIAHTASGLSSDPSYPTTTQAFDQTAPTSVSGLNASGTLTGINLSWTGSTSTDVSAQDLYVEEGPTAYLYATPSTLAASVRTAVKTVAAGRDYTASVVARDAAGNLSNATSVTVLGTNLAISRSVATVTYGGASVLSAKLTKVTGGAAITNTPITFQWRKKGTSAWANFTAVKTGTTAPYVGIARLTVKPGYNTEYRAIYNGGTKLLGRYSGVTNVLVKTKITSSLSATSIRYGSYVYFRATVAPNHKYQYVYVQRLTSGVWRTVATVKLSAYSTINYRYKPPAKGTLYYRIYKGADSDHVAATGSTLTIKVS